MKKFDIPCAINGQVQQVTLCIGQPHPEQHPLNFQQKWLAETKNGRIPQNVMDSIAKVKELADKNGVPFEDLCYYAINLANNRIPIDQIDEGYNKILQLMGGGNSNNDNDGNNKIE